MTREELPPPRDPGPEPDDLSDPRHPDHDLSDWAPYSIEDERAKPWFIRRWVYLLVACLVISSLVLSVLLPLR
jgi:hypothetical protein